MILRIFRPGPGSSPSPTIEMVAKEEIRNVYIKWFITFLSKRHVPDVCTFFFLFLFIVFMFYIKIEALFFHL